MALYPTELLPLTKPQISPGTTPNLQKLPNPELASSSSLWPLCLTVVPISQIPTDEEDSQKQTNATRNVAHLLTGPQNPGHCFGNKTSHSIRPAGSALTSALHLYRLKMYKEARPIYWASF